MVQIWSDQDLIDGVVELHQQKVPLIKSEIKPINSKLWWAIESGRQRKLKGINQVRKAASKQLSYQGKIMDAWQIESYNFSAPERDLRQLMAYAIHSDTPFDLHSMRDIRPSLVDRILGHQRGNYYSFLGMAQQRLHDEGHFEAAQRIDPEFWIKRGTNETALVNQQKKKLALEQILVISMDQQYGSELIPHVEFEGQIDGLGIQDLLDNSSDWLSTKELASQISCDKSNIKRNIVTNPKYSCFIIRSQGKQPKYYFHYSIIDVYQRNSHSKSKTTSFNSLAKMYDASVESVTQFAHLIFDVRNHTNLTDEHILKLSIEFDNRRAMRKCLIDSVDPKQVYSREELEKVGIYSKKLTNGANGAVVIEHIKKNYNRSMTPRGFNIISTANDDLYTGTDLERMTGERRINVYHKLQRIFDRNPNAGYRLRKNNDSKAKMILPSETVNSYFITGQGIENIDILGFLNGEIPAFELGRFIDLTDSLTSGIDEMHHDVKDRTLETLSQLRQYYPHSNSLQSSQNLANLNSIIHFMDVLGYHVLEMDSQYSLNEIRQQVSNYETTLDLIDRIEYKLVQSYNYIISDTLTAHALRFNQHFEAYRDLCEFALAWAVIDTNLTTHHEFSIFARDYMNTMIDSMEDESFELYHPIKVDIEPKALPEAANF